MLPTRRCLVVLLVLTLVPALAGRARRAEGAPEDDEPEALAPGLVARLTADAAPGVVATRAVPDLAWDWAAGAPDVRLPADGFRLDAEGLLLVQAPGAHRFAVRSDGAVTLKVNGVVVSDGADGARAEPPVELRAGFARWSLSYRHGRGEARLAVDWEGPAFAREPLPARLLYHDPAAAPPADRFEQGRRLADRLGCAGCHALIGLPAHAGVGPPLDGVARSTAPGWLPSWLQDPAAFRPGTRMPGFGAGLSDAEAADLAAFLATPGTKAKGAAGALTAEAKMALNVADPAQGRLLFRSLGCLGCHGIGEAPGAEPAPAPDLAGLGRKRSREAIAAYLEHPRSGKVPARHRPDLRLNADQSAHLAAYLAEGGPPPDRPATPPAPAGDPKRGRALAERLRCAACHEVPGLERTARLLPLGPGSRPDAGCLADAPPPKGVGADVPRFALSDEARGALRALVAGLPRRPSAAGPDVLAADAIRRRNCLGCHTRDGRGGTDLAGRLAPLLASDPALGGLKGTLTPPNLTATGDKLRAEYLATAIRGAAPVARPWLSVRMPVFAFEPGEADAIAGRFRAHDRTRPADDPPAPSKAAALEPAAREAAARLIGQKGFGCVSCHVLNGRIPPGGEPENLGPDLALAHRRMTERYFRRWISDPQRVIAGTPMPQFLKPIEGIPGTLDEQLSAVWRLLGSTDLAAVAASGTREVLRRDGDRALVVRDMVLMPGLPDTEYTPRGLAVGLKNGASLLFDTDRLGWLSAWRGGFLSRTKSGRLWEWHPDGNRLWTAPRRLAPVVLVAADGAVRGPSEIRERFGTFRLLEFHGDGVRLAYREHFADGVALDVTEEIQPRETGWDRTVRVAGVPDGSAPALVEQPPVAPGHSPLAEWPAGPDRVTLSWDATAAPLAIPGAPGAVGLRLRPAGGGAYEGRSSVRVAPGK